MDIGLIDVDGHNWPNLALMKLSAYHKRCGDAVEMWNGLKQYDRVYMSRVFDDTYTRDMPYCISADEIIRGGTGYDLKSRLPEEIEHVYPDYGLYGVRGEAYGYLTRGCPRACAFCIVSDKEGRASKKVANLNEFWRGQRVIKLLDPNMLASCEADALLQQLAESGAYVDFTQGLDARLLTPDNIKALNHVKIKMLHFAWDFMCETDAVLRGLELYAKIGTVKDERKRRVYVLTNFDTAHSDDLYRVEALRKMGYDPYVMIYNKPSAPRETRRLQRYVNNKIIWRSCESFEKYKD